MDGNDGASNRLHAPGHRASNPSLRTGTGTGPLSPTLRARGAEERSRPTMERVTSGSSEHVTFVRGRETEQQPDTTSPRRNRANTMDASAPPPSFRYRFGSTQPSPSPGPAKSMRSAYTARRSVAIAASTARDADTASRKFSLAGPAPVETLTTNQPYVDPGYAQLNPAYEQPTNVRPVWSLAKPLPHVLRPGMVPTTDEVKTELLQLRDSDYPDPDIESGRIEPSFRLDKVNPQLDRIRQERELQLFEHYSHASPAFSPRERRSSDVTETQENRRQDVLEEVPEEEESLLEPSHLTESLEQVKRANEINVPYVDAVPLKAYESDDDEVHNLHTYWSVIRLRFREPLAEFLAITVQLTIGFSVNLSIAVSHGEAGVGDTGDWGWGLATMIAIYIAGGISGAHLNPAMSLMLYVYRGFPLRKMPSYIFAQMLGAFLAALISFAIFQPGIIALGEPELGKSGTSGNFITFPRQEWVYGGSAFFTEFTGTAILAVSVLALGDDANAPPGAGMNAFIIGLVVTVLGMAYGYNTGLAMNPARDFGPRIALLVLGYGRKELFANSNWFTITWLGPIVGALFGAFLYDAAIFTGGESPVNYPPKRIKRTTRKWKKRWAARLGRTKRKLEDVKDDVNLGYGSIGRD